jgi:hypothetical protein
MGQSWSCSGFRGRPSGLQHHVGVVGGKVETVQCRRQEVGVLFQATRKFF